MLPFLLQGLALYWVSASFLSPNTDIRLFYVTTLAVALGRSGKLPVFKAFLADQFRRGNHDIVGKEIDHPTTLWWGTASVLAAIIAFAISTFTWATKFLICALVYRCKSFVVLVWLHLLLPRNTNWEPTWYLFWSVQGSHIQEASELPKYTKSVSLGKWGTKWSALREPSFSNNIVAKISIFQVECSLCLSIPLY